jgi:hypothetical protein
VKRAWIVDLLSAVIQASLVVAVLVIVGAPNWAAIGFGLTHYLLRPLRWQEAEARRRAAA